MKFYICPVCGELITEEKILEGCDQGGVGLCMCDYVQYLWDEDARLLRVDFTRRYHDYVEISEGLFRDLSRIRPDVSRLKAFEQVPAGQRLLYLGSD